MFQLIGCGVLLAMFSVVFLGMTCFLYAKTILFIGCLFLVACFAIPCITLIQAYGTKQKSRPEIIVHATKVYDSYKIEPNSNDDDGVIELTRRK